MLFTNQIKLKTHQLKIYSSYIYFTILSHILLLFLLCSLIYKWKTCRQHTDIDKQYESSNLQKYHLGGTAAALAEDHFATASYSSAQNSQSQ